MRISGNVSAGTANEVATVEWGKGEVGEHSAIEKKVGDRQGQ